MTLSNRNMIQINIQFTAAYNIKLRQHLWRSTSCQGARTRVEDFNELREVVLLHSAQGHHVFGQTSRNSICYIVAALLFFFIFSHEAMAEKQGSEVCCCCCF